MKILALALSLLLSSCADYQQQTTQQEVPIGMICHVQGVPNACYVFTPKSFEVRDYSGGFIFRLTEEDNSKTFIYNMSCLVMPRDRIGDGACSE